MVFRSIKKIVAKIPVRGLLKNVGEKNVYAVLLSKIRFKDDEMR